MIRRLVCLTLAAAAAAVVPSAASAGQYSVTACFDSINRSWEPNRSNGSADAFIECPGGVSVNGRLTGGMVARNTGGAASAPGYSSAKVFFDAPPGARIVRVTGEINQTSTSGWQAGIRDETLGRWLWCGTGCQSTFGLWAPFDIGGLSTGRVAALVICGRTTCPRDALHALAALRNVTVVVAEDSAPSVSIAGGSLAQRGWRRSWQDVVVGASDGVGIRSTSVLIDGQTKRSAERACDATRAVPCPNGGNSFQIQTAEFADGLHTLAAAAVDSAGNRSQVTRRIGVDNTSPNRPIDLGVDGGMGWRATNSFRLRWTNPRESAAPIAGASVELCPIGPVAPGVTCTTSTPSGPGLSSAAGIRVPGPGQ